MVGQPITASCFSGRIAYLAEVDQIRGVKSPSWAGKNVFIVGGGPSLKEFDFDSIRGIGITLGVNNSAFAASTDALFSLDSIWCEKMADHCLEFQGEAWCAVKPSFKHWRPGVNYIERIRGDGLSDDPRRVMGLTSGHGAINLAYHQGAKSIYLLGFDMKVGGHQEHHWHAGYAWNHFATEKLYAQWARSFEKMLPQLENRGIQVINLNPESQIQCFPKCPPALATSQLRKKVLPN